MRSLSMDGNHDYLFMSHLGLMVCEIFGLGFLFYFLFVFVLGLYDQNTITDAIACGDAWCHNSHL